MSQPTDSVTFTWEIDDFANKDVDWNYMESSRFETKQAEFWLVLYPLNALKHMGNHMAVYLQRYLSDETDLKVLFTISLLNQKEEKCYLKTTESNFTADCYKDSVDGGVYHLDREIILKPSNGLLQADGKLIIQCTVTILDDPNSSRTVGIVDSTKLAQNKTLENYQSLLDNPKFSDVVFGIGKKEFKLHKNILASQSPVFSAMFENDLEEAKQNRVEITDIDVEVFEVMVRFIYTANVDSVQQYALDLFVAADKYQLNTLKEICAHSLGSNLVIESVANILLVADMHSEAQLKSKCIEFINNNENTTEVLATDGWKVLAKRKAELVHDLYYDMTKKFCNR